MRARFRKLNRAVNPTSVCYRTMKVLSVLVILVSATGISDGVDTGRMSGSSKNYIKFDTYRQYSSPSYSYPARATFQPYQTQTQRFTPQDAVEQRNDQWKPLSIEARRGRKLELELANTIPRLSPSLNQGSKSIESHILLDMRPNPTKNSSFRYLRISNRGDQDETISITVLDSFGQPIPVKPSQFPLGHGATAEIPVSISNLNGRSSNLRQASTLAKQGQEFPPTKSSRPGQKMVGVGVGTASASGFSTSTTTRNANNPKGIQTDWTDLEASGSDNIQQIVQNPEQHNSGMITVVARGRRETIKRSFVFEDPYNYPTQPFCIDKDVVGTCRYRDDPVDCFKWHWKAYATILNNFGSYKQIITSIPEGLVLNFGEHGRARVYLEISCCTPFVQFLSNDPSVGGLSSCVVDVRELQALHPGEIAGIVIACVLLLLIIIAVIILCLRRRRRETINNANGAMLPRLKSRTRTGSDNKVYTRQ